jgi:UDP-N-acetylmuramyl tripeptide synthase
MIGEAIRGSGAHLYLNADDPLVAHLARLAHSADEVSFFGVEGMMAGATQAAKTVRDSDRCPVCRRRLDFSRVFYGHIGHYSCPNHDFQRPQPHVAVTRVLVADVSGTQFELSLQGKRYLVHYPLPGTYNLYNATAAFCVATGFGLDPAVAVQTLEATTAAFGRVETMRLKGRKLWILLIKNPAGFTQVLETFLLGRTKANVLLAIHDRDADGRDVSWLWDVPLELLAECRPRLGVTGLRSADMLVRLKYAGLEAWRHDGIGPALEAIVSQAKVGEDVYLLPTYTAMREVREVLLRLPRIEQSR